MTTGPGSDSRKPAQARVPGEESSERCRGARASSPERTIDRMHVEAGWPPRMARATDVETSPSVSSRRHFTVRDQRLALQAALAHPEVEELLVGRWEVLGCALVCERGMPRDVQHRSRVSLFNYTKNQLVEVCVEDETAVSVRLKAPHEHPESPIEMAQAIALARGAPAIREQVDGLTAHAILQVPDDPHSTSYMHRCILVMFTEEDDRHRELPVQYSAMVDLRLQRVLAAGPTPCAQQTPCPRKTSRDEAAGRCD
jgi:hypothetical protein